MSVLSIKGTRGAPVALAIKSFATKGQFCKIQKSGRICQNVLQCLEASRYLDALTHQAIEERTFLEVGMKGHPSSYRGNLPFLGHRPPPSMNFHLCKLSHTRLDPIG